MTDRETSERRYSRAVGLVRLDGEVASDGTGPVTLAHPAGGWLLASEAPPLWVSEHITATGGDRDALLAGRRRSPGATPSSRKEAP